MQIAGFGVAASMFPTFTFAAAGKPSVSITIDDFNPQAGQMAAARRNQAILTAFRKHNLKGTFFVAGKFLKNDAMLGLVRECGLAGHQVANHSYSHWFYPGKTFEEFSADVMKMHEMIKGIPNFAPLFRFPFLKEGDTAEQRDKMRDFLKQKGYRNGHVTIDTSDWYIADRLRAKLRANPNTDVEPFRKFYLEHILDRANYYESLSQKALGRSVSHTILLHWNIATELFLGDLLDMFKQKGWALKDSKKAFDDEVFAAKPDIAPAGESILWSLAKASGKFNDILRYPAEDGDYEKSAMDKLGL